MRAYGLGAGRPRITLVGCGLALVASLSIRSAGIALVVGLAAWLAASWLTDRPRAVRRLKLCLPLLAVAILAQATWMSWVAIHEVIEWPIGGYPRSYIAQLGVKSGNHPELGAASLADIPSRVAKNLAEHVAGFTTLPTRLEYINPIWSSWFPPEEDCFAALAQTYPASFRLIQRGSRFLVYEVIARE